MTDADIAGLAGRQFNRISKDQLRALGLTRSAVQHRLSRGRLALIHEAVYAIPPVLEHDPWGRWAAATLTSPDTMLSRGSAGTAWGFWSRDSPVTVTRPGCGGPRLLGSVLVYRSRTVLDDRTTLRGIAITTVERTLLDLATEASPRALARGLREAIRLRLTNSERLADALGRRRHGSALLAATLARYSGLPLERARSGAEVRALEVLREAQYALPQLNARIAREEADLCWRPQRLIIEVDGGPFHLDRGEDQRKERAWRDAGWTVARISSNAVYENPMALLRLAGQLGVPSASP